MNHCYIAFGSNVGDRKANLEKGLFLLAFTEKVKLLEISSLYETPPWGMTAQAPFLNGVCYVETELSLPELLAVLQSIEIRCGRERLIHWGPRTLDLDIIYNEEGSYEDNSLIVPHEYFWDRLFVLYPLSELRPSFSFQGEAIEARIADLPKEDIVIVEKTPWFTAFSL